MSAMHSHMVHAGSKGKLSFILFVALVFSLLSPLSGVSAQGKTTLDISKGSITIGNGTVTGRTPSGTAAAYNENGFVITSSTSAATANTITINGGEHVIVLQGVKISTGYNGASPVSVSKAGAKVQLVLSGSSVLTSGNPQKAALGVSPGAELVIATVDNTDNHVLGATGYGGYAAAIGGGASEASGTIVINNGGIQAKFTRSGNYGAAIGGGQGGAGGQIVINGGNVVAESYGGSAAAIGGGQSSAGYGGKTTEVTVNGGTVTTKIPNAATYDSIGYGKVSAAQAAAVEAATTVTVNGGHIIARNDSSNITSLLYKRQPVNGEGNPVYAVGIKLDDSSATGTLVDLDYDGGQLVTKTTSGGYVYVFLPQGSQDVVVTREDTGAEYYGAIAVSGKTSGQAFQAAVAARAILTAPIVAVVNDDPEDAELNDGKWSVLKAANIGEVLNAGGYPLQVGIDFTVQWFKGTVPVDGDADASAELSVSPDQGDVYRAKFVALNGGKAAGESSFSVAVKALASKEPNLPGVAARLEVTSAAEFTRLPDPTAGAITYTVKLLGNDGANTPIEGATVRFYQDGSPYPYTRVTGAGDKAGEIKFTFSALLPGEHSIRIAYDGGKANGIRYDAASYFKAFTVVKPAAPSGFWTIAAKSGTTNGKIYGADPSLEYIDWIPTIGNNQQIHSVTGTVIENLKPNLYSIRYKAWYNGDVYSLASDYRYLVWVQTAQWTVTPVETESVTWGTGAIDVIAGGSAQLYVEPKAGFEIQPDDINIKYADYSYDSETRILTLSRITSNIRIAIDASAIQE